jgi:hypothetical protein
MMRKRFTGNQSGHWTALCKKLLEENYDLSVEVNGHRPIDGTSVSNLGGRVVDACWNGYIRNISVETPEGLTYTVGCSQATDEDVAAENVDLFFNLTRDTITSDPKEALMTLQGTGLLLELLRYTTSGAHKELHLLIANHLTVTEEVNLDKLWPALLVARLDSPDRALKVVRVALDRQYEAPILVDLTLMNLHHELRGNTGTDAEYVAEYIIAGLERELFKGVQNCHACETIALVANEAMWKRVKPAIVDLLFHEELRVQQAAAFALQNAIIRLGDNAAIDKDDWSIIIDRSRWFGKSEDPKLQVVALNLIEAMLTANREKEAQDLLDLSLQHETDWGDMDTPDSFRYRVFREFRRRFYLCRLWQTFHSAAVAERMASSYKKDARLLLDLEIRAFQSEWDPYLRRRAVADKRRQVFIDFAHASEQFYRIVTEIRDELQREGIKVWVAKDEGAKDSSTENVLFPKIAQPIRDSTLVIVDTTKNNFNVGYEFGFAEKCGCNVILTREKEAMWHFDILGHYIARDMEYDPNDSKDMERFKSALLAHIRKHFKGVWPPKAEDFEPLFGGILRARGPQTLARE